MNVITHAHAYALFPYSTFVCFNTAELDPQCINMAHLLADIRKYMDRGWSITPALHGNEWSLEDQRVGDVECWTIPLLDALEPPETLSLNAWRHLKMSPTEFTY